MKKFLALIMVLLLVFTCACGGGSGSKDDPYEAVKPTGEADGSMSDSTWGSFTLKHIDTDSYGEKSKDYLDLASDYLGSQGITSKIKAMYSIAFGIAGNFDEVLGVKVVFEDENVQPVYLVVLDDFREYSAGLEVMGSFRDADVMNNEYFNKVLSVADNFDNKVKSSIGFLKDDVNVLFSPRLIRDLSFKTTSEADVNLWHQLQDVYSRFTLASWYDASEEGTTVINGEVYQKITYPGITSLAGLYEYLGTAFTLRTVEEIKETFSDMISGSYPIYVEHNGALYYAPIGMGGPEDIQDAGVKYVAENDRYYFMIIEVTRCDRDDNWQPINTWYTEHLLIFEKGEGGSLGCDYYEDYIFGRFLSSMPTV